MADVAPITAFVTEAGMVDPNTHSANVNGGVVLGFLITLGLVLVFVGAALVCLARMDPGETRIGPAPLSVWQRHQRQKIRILEQRELMKECVVRGLGQLTLLALTCVSRLHRIAADTAKQGKADEAAEAARLATVAEAEEAQGDNAEVEVQPTVEVEAPTTSYEEERELRRKKKQLRHAAMAAALATKHTGLDDDSSDTTPTPRGGSPET